ncbi:MAG: Arm DNA-binding domain-containing protein, partial [Candidatus Cryptobacteroides sp.]|nr:Arm DNA-binding domain-containing protein [Bacteroidales bacterium]MDY6157806.1 Arm DNA-binding domain-containing protein [Candidatus Cryptobacteroides sp.]
MSEKRPTIKAILFTSKTLANGEHPIMLRVNFNGSRKYKSLGISCLPKDWNKEKSEVRKSHPQAKLLNKTIETAVNNAQKAYLQSDNLNKPYSAKTILSDASKEQPLTTTLYRLFD